MKRFTLASAFSLILFCILADTPVIAGRSEKPKRTSSLKRAQNSEIQHFEKIKPFRGEALPLNPAVFEPELVPFDALDWFDVLKKVFGLRASGKIHGAITRTALKKLKIKQDFIDKVVKANWHTDWDEYKKTLPPAPNDEYHPAHHFDRTYGATHADSFKRAAKYIREQRSLVLAGLKGEGGKNMNDAARAMGRALHALQDFFSHSNVIDLSPAEWEAAMNALETATDPPASLKITGYDRMRGASLVGDEYGHDSFSKENANKNEESKSKMKPGAQAFEANKTKFQRAKEAATECSADWVLDIKREIGNQAWRQIEKN